jgi:hypothetical protein
VTSCSLLGTDVAKESAASIVYPDCESSKLLSNISMKLTDCMATHPEDRL